ncbi:DHHA1 domain-containing protein, partial [Streptomyces rubrogriseus]|uniref:DHHA1 domain-containing protein n=1 Tax=Streptomyces rubrogriseus TaxID=194673 RepID=UPI0037D1B5BD
ATDVDGTLVVTATTDGDARALALAVRERLPATRPGVVVVGSPAGERATLVAAVNGAARSAGRDASALVKRLLDGRGGGSPELAQGGGIPSDRLPGTLDSVPALLFRA